MIRRASSITEVGMARGGLSALPLAFLLLSALLLLLLLLPFVAVEDLPLALDVDGDVEGWLSRTSSRTRRRSAGKVVTSPERRRSRAWFWTAVGQLEELELRAWRRASWILEKRIYG